MNKINFVKELEKRGIDCNESQLNLLWNFMHHVLDTNEKFNLTAIKDEETFVEKMIFDSALLLNNHEFEGSDLLDIGAGAGFPSVVVSILSPNTHVVALDSTAKKVNFIKEYAKRNNLNMSAVCARAEDYAEQNREKYTLVTARAVASLRILIELAMPMLKVGGVLIAMKGPGFEEEIIEAEGAFKKLKCKIDYIYEDQLPESQETRSFIYIKKVGETPKKYPRPFGEIKARPL
ncbi:MAG: 16S rRNA (guanine(527)-N(7))-methyltransferase RsmG [Bacilli bacterium]|nr:16S rRNA (guanine(527)-N(7))-methyltransferase RsmG [Bacilli bacterium]